MVKENEELKKRMSGVEEMVANLIVDQQAMAKVFQERGDRHSRSLERHRADLNTAWREIDRLQVNQSTIVDECSVLWTQVESMVSGTWYFSNFFPSYFYDLLLVLPLHTLFSQFHSSKKRQDACY